MYTIFVSERAMKHFLKLSKMTYQLTTTTNGLSFTEKFITLSPIDTNNITEVVNAYILAKNNKSFKSSVKAIQNGFYTIESL